MNSVLGRRVFVDSEAHVSESVLLANCQIGAGTRLHRVIVDRNAIIAPGTEIGFDATRDREKYHVSEGGVVVVAGPPTVVPLTTVDV